jgi:protein gp37
MTTIEWSQNDDGTQGKTWNFVRGCQEISPGCAMCYAKTFAERFRGVPGHPYEQGFDLRLVPGKLFEPLKWRGKQRVFANSMSDLMHEGVPFEFVAAAYGVIASTQHTYITLTKRADRLLSFYEWLDRQHPDARTHVLSEALRYEIESDNEAQPLHKKHCGDPEGPWPLPNLQVGVSVENRKHGLPRIDLLRQVPAAVRVLSIEPLLEDLGELDLRGIGWCLVGGESGRGARACDLAWIRSVVEQCAAANVPCFVKQFGAKAIEDSGRHTADIGGQGEGKPYVWGKVGPRGTVLRQYGLKDRKGGDPAEWPAGNWPRQFPEVSHA